MSMLQHQADAIAKAATLLGGWGSALNHAHYVRVDEIVRRYRKRGAALTLYGVEMATIDRAVALMTAARDHAALRAE
jgi:hypothetical protein